MHRRQAGARLARAVRAARWRAGPLAGWKTAREGADSDPDLDLAVDEPAGLLADGDEGMPPAWCWARGSGCEACRSSWRAAHSLLSSGGVPCPRRASG